MAEYNFSDFWKPFFDSGSVFSQKYKFDAFKELENIKSLIEQEHQQFIKDNLATKDTEDLLINSLFKFYPSLSVTEIESKDPSYFFPYKGSVLKMFEKDASKFKYIIIGQDPYHTYYQKSGDYVPNATGRAFEVANMKNWDPLFGSGYTESGRGHGGESLKIILRSILKCNESDLQNEINKHITVSPEEWFDRTENNGKGIYWINSSLTVRRMYPGSHIQIWHDSFMKYALMYLVENNSNIEKIFEFGDYARKLVDSTLTGNQKENIEIIYTCHPVADAERFIKDDVFGHMKDIIFDDK